MFTRSITITLLLFMVTGFSIAVASQGTALDVHARDNLLSPATSVVYSQPANDIPLQQQSSQVGYNRYGSDYDQYVWDSFTLNSQGVISEITWRGFYNSGGSAGGGVIDFIIGIYPSTAGGTQPDHLNPPLVQYTAGGSAGESPAWTPGSAALSLHDYSFVLPEPFTATAGVKYWVQIEGIQNSAADWGLVEGTGGNNSHFFAIPAAGDFYFNLASRDATFTLLGTPGDSGGTALAGVTISGPAAGVVGAGYTFTATIDPITATAPITYTWSPAPSSGQGMAVATYSWPTTGNKSITVAAANALSTVSNTHALTIQDKYPARLYLQLLFGPNQGK